MVDSEAFLLIMKQATKGKYNPISSRSLSRTRIPQLNQFISDHVKKIVDEENLNLGGVAFTTDIWTSATNVAFQSLTFHFITGQFKIKRLLVKLESFSEQHTGENITKKVDSSDPFDRNISFTSVPEWVVIQEKLNKLVGHYSFC